MCVVLCVNINVYAHILWRVRDQANAQTIRYQLLCLMDDVSTVLCFRVRVAAGTPKLEWSSDLIVR